MLHCPQEMLFCPCPDNFTQLLSISLLLVSDTVQPVLAFSSPSAHSVCYLQPVLSTTRTWQHWNHIFHC